MGVVDHSNGRHTRAESESGMEGELDTENKTENRTKRRENTKQNMTLWQTKHYKCLFNAIFTCIHYCSLRAELNVYVHGLLIELGKFLCIHKLVTLFSTCQALYMAVVTIQISRHKRFYSAVLGWADRNNR